jgi:hypothetical protein
MRIIFWGYDPRGLALQRFVCTGFTGQKQTMRLIRRCATGVIPAEVPWLGPILQRDQRPAGERETRRYAKVRHASVLGQWLPKDATRGHGNRWERESLSLRAKPKVGDNRMNPTVANGCQPGAAAKAGKGNPSPPPGKETYHTAVLRRSVVQGRSLVIVNDDSRSDQQEHLAVFNFSRDGPAKHLEIAGNGP